MQSEEPDSVHQLLTEIRDNQRQALQLQRESVAMARTQFERAERLHDRAERIQATSESIMGGARKLLVVVVPVLIGLIVYVSWLIFR